MAGTVFLVTEIDETCLISLAEGAKLNRQTATDLLHVWKDSKKRRFVLSFVNHPRDLLEVDTAFILNQFDMLAATSRCRWAIVGSPDYGRALAAKAPGGWKACVGFEFMTGDEANAAFAAADTAKEG